MPYVAVSAGVESQGFLTLAGLIIAAMRSHRDAEGKVAAGERFSMFPSARSCSSVLKEASWKRIGS